MHTLLDLRGSIPSNIHITNGRLHDSNELDILIPEPYAFYIMDKAYVDFDALFRFHIAGAYWVSRPKENMREEIVFITNNTEISAPEVACLYRHRWDIEVFFKWIKQNLVVKTLWGYSKNAVRTHLRVSVIAYLLIAKIKADYKCPYSISELATLVRVSALERTNLRELITKSLLQKNIRQVANEPLLFDCV